MIPDDHAAFLATLARLIAPLVARELAGVGVVYTAKDPPPGRSSRWARENLRKIPGACVHGRSWSVTREAWLAYEAAEADRRRARRNERGRGDRRPVARTSGVSGAALLEAAGLRRTR